MTEEHRRKLSEAHKGKPNPNKGKKQSEETRLKRSLAMKCKQAWNKGLKASENEKIKALVEKATQTKIKKFGNGFGNNNMSEDHKKKIGLSNKGNINPFKGKSIPIERKNKISQSKMGHKTSDDAKYKMSQAKIGKYLEPEKLLIKTTKQYLTRKKNDSFNKSKVEEDFYSKLLKENVNKTIYRQYKDSRYPFYCDFYIKEDDLFIEVNDHWTHGYKPYDPNDEFCQKQLLEWQEKAKTSQFYKNAIETWTVRDVKKQKIAKENNLNYKVIY